MPRQTPQTGSLYSPNGCRKYLTASERVRFIAAAWCCPRPAQRTLCLTLAYTGCRISEALSLTVAAVECSESFLAFRSLKKRTHIPVIRAVPIPSFLLHELESVHGLATAEPSQRLWPWCRGRAWQLVKAVMHNAGIGIGIYATPKGLRHSFGLHAIRSGCPLNLVQRWLGHARMETTSIYLQAIGPEERDIALRMWGVLSLPHSPARTWSDMMR